MNNGNIDSTIDSKYYYCTNPVPRRHDASKCKDSKCCDKSSTRTSYKSSGRCDKNFRQIKGGRCYRGKSYFCLPPYRPKNHNKKKCLVDGKKDKDCCVPLVLGGKPSCSNGYEVKLTHEACSSKNKKDVRFYCLPPSPPDDHNPKKCL